MAVGKGCAEVKHMLRIKQAEFSEMLKYIEHELSLVKIYKFI